MDPLCSSFGKGIVLPFLASLALIGTTVNAGIKGSFKCTPPPMPLTCETNHLPYVGNGSFDCPPDSKVNLGNTCNLTCKGGFYPASTDQAVCKTGIGGSQRRSWSQGNFACNAYGGRTDGSNGGRTDDPNSLETDGPNGEGTYGLNGERTDATNGGVTDATNGGGTDDTNGEGTDTTNGGGKDATNGGGTDAATGEGTDATNSEGTDATNGRGTDATNGEGKDATNGGETDAATGEGTDATNGEGTDATNGGGTDSNGGGSDDVAVRCNSDDLPKEPPHGSFDCPEDTTVFNTCNLTCDVGFYPAPDNTTTCEPGVSGDPIGHWSNGNFECRVITCEKGALPEVHSGSFDCPGQISLNNTCNLTCDVGLYPVSANTTTCELGVTGHPIGSWSTGTFDCHVITCESDGLPDVHNGSFDCTEDTSLNSNCNLMCDVGFYPTSATTTTCELGVRGDPIGHWSSGTFECHVIACNSTDLPEEPAHGSFDCPEYTTVFNTCNLTCDVGFYPASASTTTCEPEVSGDPIGQWSNGNFECRVITCERNGLPEVHNGSFDCTEDTSLNSTCNLICDVGFYLTSATTTTCELGVRGDPIGHWSNGTFECHDCSSPNHWDGSIYQFYVVNMTHANARNKCQGVGSAIAIIESLEENDFVNELVKKCAPDNGQWGGWTWIDPSGYTNWDASEPSRGLNAQCVREDCNSMKYDSGKWHTQCCEREFYPVCEHK